MQKKVLVVHFHLQVVQDLYTRLTESFNSCLTEMSLQIGFCVQIITIFYLLRAGKLKFGIQFEYYSTAKVWHANLVSHLHCLGYALVNFEYSLRLSKSEMVSTVRALVRVAIKKYQHVVQGIGCYLRRECKYRLSANFHFHRISDFCWY